MLLACAGLGSPSLKLLCLHHIGRSDQLKDVLEQAESEDISSLVQLHQTVIEGEADYQDALDKSLRIPGCKVVPYFGVFLDQLVAVWEEPSPALSMSMLEMEREVSHTAVSKGIYLAEECCSKIVSMGSDVVVACNIDDMERIEIVMGSY